MKNAAKIIGLVLAVIMIKIALVVAVILVLLRLPACAVNYEHKGMDEYLGGRSSVEIDEFCGVDELTENFECLESDYRYVYREEAPYYNICETALLYFRYSEEEYARAKEYYREAVPDLGDEATEIYGEYMFYDYYAKRPKDEYYHCDDYPEAFKRVAFNDANHTIVLLGIYTSDQVTEEVEQDVSDWGAFLKKYFDNIYSFDE